MYIMRIQNRQYNSRESFAMLILFWVGSPRAVAGDKLVDTCSSYPRVENPSEGWGLAVPLPLCTSGGGIVAGDTGCDGGASGSDSDEGYGSVEAT
jgi:hypothetical protein